MYPSVWLRGTSVLPRKSSEICLDTYLVLGSKRNAGFNTTRYSPKRVAKKKKGRSVHLLVSVSMTQPSALNVNADRSKPKLVHWVPSEIVICDRIRDAPQIPSGKHAHSWL